MITRILLTWVLFLPIPIINGLLREKVYKSVLGSKASQWVGCIALSLIFLVYAFVSLRVILANLDTADLFLVGLIWLLLTLCFEFGLGLATGKSWEFMLEDYKIWKGRVWPMVPLVIFLSPFIVSYAYLLLAVPLV